MPDDNRTGSIIIRRAKGTKMKKQEYVEYVDGRAKKSPILKNCLCAFLIGGLICVIGQTLLDLYVFWGINEKDAGTLASISLIFIAALLTGLGVFDNIAKIAGAGTLVPITGFANAISSQAIEDIYNRGSGYCFCYFKRYCVWRDLLRLHTDLGVGVDEKPDNYIKQSAQNFRMLLCGRTQGV